MCPVILHEVQNELEAAEAETREDLVDILDGLAEVLFHVVFFVQLWPLYIQHCSCTHAVKEKGIIQQISFSLQFCGFGNYTTFTNFSMKYLVMCKVYTDVGGIK